MFKALLKKQLTEINSYLFQNKRTGVLYGKRKIALVTCLYALLFAAIGVSFASPEDAPGTLAEVFSVRGKGY